MLGEAEADAIRRVLIQIDNLMRASGTDIPRPYAA